MTKALDLYCGAGGTTYGIQKCGVEVTGVDARPQPRYCGDKFIQRNVLSLDPKWIRQNFDFVFASPPCQAFVTLAHQGEHHNLIPPTRELLNKTGLPWVIENVPRAPLKRYIMLCGTQFVTLRVVRHRRFEYSEDLSLYAPLHESHPHLKVYSFDRRPNRPNAKNEINEWDSYITVAGNNASLAAMSDAMNIWWMSRKEIAQAIPWRYSLFITRQIVEQLELRRAA